MGLSKVKQHTLVSGGVRGTLPWMAPELLSGKTNMVTEKVSCVILRGTVYHLYVGSDMLILGLIFYVDFYVD